MADFLFFKSIKTSQKGMWITGLLTLLFSVLLFGDLLTHPNYWMYSTGGDGLKNYFTPSWAIKHDGGMWFSGMNYPFGEHITYTDAQPLLVWVLSALNSWGLPIEGHVPGILNALMVLSLVPASMLLFRILKHYQIPFWWSIGFALIITFLSPQLERWQGHYALGYVLFVPLLWYLSIKSTTVQKSIGKKWIGYQALLLLCIIAFALIHLYYMLMAGAFLLAYAFVLYTSGKTNLYKAVLTGLTPIIAVLSVYIFISITDPVTDRTAAPYGFTYYKAHFENIFIPRAGFFRNIWQTGIDIRKVPAEGNGYVGFAGLLILMWIIFRAAKRITRFQTTRPWRMALPGDLGIWVPASLLVLAFSMAIPFRWRMEGLLDLLPPIKQFRSPGRMVWVFYYVWTVLSVVLIYQFYRHFKKKGYGLSSNLTIGLIFIFWAAEAWNQTNLFATPSRCPNILNQKEIVPLLKDINTDEFQAMLTLPYYHMGSEKLYIDRGAGALTWGMRAAIETGIPLINVMMSRTSLSQTLETTALISPYSKPDYLISKMDGRDILLLVQDARLNTTEQEFIESSELLAEGDGYTLRRFDPSVLNSLWADKKINTSTEVTDKTNGILKDFTQSKVYADTINFGVWVGSYTEVASYPIIELKEIDSNGDVIAKREIATKLSTDVIDDFWVLASIQFQPKEETELITASAKGKSISVVNFYWK
ncbi:MAG: hypothetical protein ACI959_001166 [Limisphaerales bacterium]|jgi:hypothetical protein